MSASSRILACPRCNTLRKAALDFAAGRHRGQRRKVSDKSPYINHLITVATLVANTECATDPIVFAAAVLHDGVEDAGVTPGKLAVCLLSWRIHRRRSAAREGAHRPMARHQRVSQGTPMASMAARISSMTWAGG
ncbi:MAG: HD domain-containing protein, partial [Spirochaetes bacterium]|nr:HD domain-containing protein [Spirochaetota bacterium]